MSTLVSAVVPSTADAPASQIVEQAGRLGAALSLPEGLDIARDSGLVPCLLDGQQAAFEFTRDEGESAGSAVLQFEARTSYASLVASAYVAASVAVLSGGHVRDEDGRCYSGTALTDWLSSMELPVPESDANELRIEVRVVGPRGNGLLQLELGKVPPGAHLARRLVESIDVAMVPPALRIPNSRFVIAVRDASEIVSVETLGRRTR